MARQQKNLPRSRGSWDPAIFALSLIIFVLGGGGWVWNNIHHLYGPQFSLGLAGGGGMGALVALRTGWLLHQAGRTARVLAAMAAENPAPTAGRTPRYLEQFRDIVDLADQFNDAQRGYLAEVYQRAWTGRHDRVLEHALDIAEKGPGRMTAAVKAEWSRLNTWCPAAAAAALAVLVRDLLHFEAFQILTQPWVSGTSVMVGGDVHDRWHVRLETREHRAAGPVSWQPNAVENVPADSGEDARQVLTGILHTLLASRIDEVEQWGNWRLRIWPGALPLDEQPRTAPAWEIYQSQAQPLRVKQPVTG